MNRVTARTLLILIATMLGTAAGPVVGQSTTCTIATCCVDRDTCTANNVFCCGQSVIPAACLPYCAAQRPPSDDPTPASAGHSRGGAAGLVFGPPAHPSRVAHTNLLDLRSAAVRAD